MKNKLDYKLEYIYKQDYRIRLSAVDNNKWICKLCHKDTLHIQYIIATNTNTTNNIFDEQVQFNSIEEAIGRAYEWLKEIKECKNEKRNVYKNR